MLYLWGVYKPCTKILSNNYYKLSCNKWNVDFYNKTKSEKKKKKRGVRLILFQHLKEWWRKVESHECVCSTLLKARRCSTRWCCGQTLQTQMRCREIHNWLQAVLFLSVIPHDRLIHFEAERKVFIVHHFNWFMRIQTRGVCQGYHHWRDKLQLQNLRLLAFKSVSKCLQGELDGFSV